MHRTHPLAALERTGEVGFRIQNRSKLEVINALKRQSKTEFPSLQANAPHDLCGQGGIMKKQKDITHIRSMRLLCQNAMTVFLLGHYHRWLLMQSRSLPI